MHKGRRYLAAAALWALLVAEPSRGAEDVVAEPSRGEEAEDTGAAVVDDETCDAADLECSLSLRQLRAGALSPEEAEAEGEAEKPHGRASLSQFGAIKEAVEARRGGAGHSAEKQGTLLDQVVQRKDPHHHSRSHSHSHRHQGSGQRGTTMIGYHQTSGAICNTILTNGFQPGSNGWCGGGIYFAQTPRATGWKAIGEDSHKGCILRATIAIGRPKRAGRRCDHLYGAKVKRQGYDSILFDPGDGLEIVVFDPSRITSITRV